MSPHTLPNGPVIVWFRQDLRIRDQAALSAAAASGRPVLPLYVLDDDTPGRWRMGAASRWWHGSLAQLSTDLARLVARLILRRGAAHDVVASVAREIDAAAVPTEHLPAIRSTNGTCCPADRTGREACARAGGPANARHRRISTISSTVT